MRVARQPIGHLLSEGADVRFGGVGQLLPGHE